MGIGNVTLSAEDRDRISDAVRAAEEGTKAEIVPMLVRRSGLYRDARHRSGLIMALLMLTGLLTMDAGWLPWGWHAAGAAWVVLMTVGAYAVGVWMGASSLVVRAVTSSERMKEKVRLRAERAFARHGISQTDERTGVLIMLSLLERQVYILPDRGLGRLVSAVEWHDVTQIIIERVRTDGVAEGLCAGIARCGAILSRVCPASSAGGNPNEIADRVIEEP